MLTQEDDVEIHALAARGWSVSAIARHTGRDRKTVRKYLTAERPRREPAPSCLEPYLEYISARFADDAHLQAKGVASRAHRRGLRPRVHDVGSASCGGWVCGRSA